MPKIEKTNKYTESGVDIKNADEVIDEIIKPLAQTTVMDNIIGNIGGFAGIYDLGKILKNYDHPLLLSSTDGVGSKLSIAHEVNKHDTIGIDLVAMCVNDLITHGGDPLFFLDYLAMEKLEKHVISQIMMGIVEGCNQSNMNLLGGETAEMPTLYKKSEYDLAGFVIGIVDKKNLLPRSDEINNQDVVLALPSSGIHSNGFSLVRKIVKDNKINYHDQSPWHNKTWGEILLTPTLIYCDRIKAIKPFAKAIANITGGGIINNTQRILPKNMQFILNKDYQFPEIFQWLQLNGNVSREEMIGVFNCGIGMTLIASKENADIIMQNNKDIMEIGYLI